MSKKTKKQLPDYWWNYRVVRRSVKRPGGQKETWLEIVEGHYDKQKSASIPRMITPQGATVYGDSRKQLKWALRKMLKAVDKPILNYRKYVSAKHERRLREQGLL